jgi:hypothetical protein
LGAALMLSREKVDEVDESVEIQPT